VLTATTDIDQIPDPSINLLVLSTNLLFLSLYSHIKNTMQRNQVSLEQLELASKIFPLRRDRACPVLCLGFPRNVAWIMWAWQDKPLRWILLARRL